MRKKKVAVLNVQCAFMRGGAEALASGLTAELKRRGFEAELVTMPFKWYPPQTLLDSYLQWRMLDLSESCGEKIDLVIATKAPTFMIRHERKSVWLMHQHRIAYDLRDNVPAGGLNTVPGGPRVIEQITAMDTQALMNVPEIFTISQNVSDRLQAYNGLLSTPLYHPPAQVGRYQSGPFGSYMLSVGRLDPNKRIHLMIEALKYCDRHITLKIAGRGREDENLKALTRKFGVEDRVEFLGFVPDDDVIHLYAEALGVCFPPIDEDYGYITLEAFLSHKPIVTCKDSGGVLEFAHDQENSLVVSPDPKALGACFQKLYSNRKLASELGHAGYELVKGISWDRVIDELTKPIR